MAEGVVKEAAAVEIRCQEAPTIEGLAKKIEVLQSALSVAEESEAENALAIEQAQLEEQIHKERAEEAEQALVEAVSVADRKVARAEALCQEAEKQVARAEALREEAQRRAA